MIDTMCNKIYLYLWKAANRKKEEEYRRRFQIHPSARLNYIENIWLKGNIYIGAYTYINSGRFTSGPDTRIVIGEWCAIAHNVSIMGWTHDLVESTGPEDQRPSVQKDVIIGDHVWIGTNAFIREGVNIGSNSIIGANSVVTNDVPANAVVGGIPARIIKYKVA